MQSINKQPVPATTGDQKPINKIGSDNLRKYRETKAIKSKLTLMTNTPFTVQQILVLLQKTPAKHIYKRPAKGGGEWEYVTGVYIKKVLNYAFGFLWSSDVLEVREKHNQIQATVKLTIHNMDGSELIHKTDIGKKDIVFKKGTEIPLDYGNDEKSAVTDGLKRCAAQFGVASDVYGREEFKEIQVEKMIEEYRAKKELPATEKDSLPATQAQLDVLNKAKIDTANIKTFRDAAEAIAKI
jgi:recombination DNA repair RAD52 pathway protein